MQESLITAAIGISCIAIFAVTYAVVGAAQKSKTGTVCKDGWISYGKNSQGRCSWHNGVDDDE